MEPWYKLAEPREQVRKGRSFNPDEFAVAVVTGQSGGLVGMNEKFPHLKGFSCDLFVIWLNYGDLIK